MNGLCHDIKCALGQQVFSEARSTMLPFKANPPLAMEPSTFSVPFSLPLSEVDVEALTRLAQESYEMFWDNREALVELINDLIMEDVNRSCRDVFVVKMLRVMNLDELLEPILPTQYWWKCLCSFNHLKLDFEFRTHIVGIIQKI